jgi:hypothetical protein
MVFESESERRNKSLASNSENVSKFTFQARHRRTRQRRLCKNNFTSLRRHFFYPVTYPFSIAMARATRSSTQHQEKEKEKLSDAASFASRSKIVTKKRKRAPASHDDDQPASKQLRTDWDVKDETGSEPDTALTKDNNLLHIPFAGDMPIDPSDSQKILDVLQM